jgi:magnesium-transporting ATPase (P-type)
MFNEKKWADLKCGDFVLIEDGEHFPADIVILLSSAENGEFFV